jgi:hypothetical protein
MMNDWDPYEKLMELQRFAEHADQHIHNLSKNQKTLIDTINIQHKEIELINKRLKKLEARNETTGTK